jgi:hypothetical protein
MQRDDELVLASPVLRGLIEPFAAAFPSSQDFEGYHHHCLRMLNVVLRLSEDEPDRRQKTEIALAFHDLTLFPNRTLDYLEPSVQLAGEHLSRIGRADWHEQISLMIRMHHKITAYRGPHANLVEATRKADWIDVSFGALSFGLDRDWLSGLHKRFPLYSFYPRTLVPVIARYAVTHLARPLPNFRW